MRASESPFQSYESKRILFFANLICFSVSGFKALKNVSAFCHTQLEWKVMERFRFVQKSLSLKKYFKRKNLQTSFVVYVLIYPLSKSGANRTNSLWVLALYNVRFKGKNWFEKTALNMSIKRLIFTSGQNNDFFFTLEISFGSLRKIEIPRKLPIWRYTVPLKNCFCIFSCFGIVPAYSWIFLTVTCFNHVLSLLPSGSGNNFLAFQTYFWFLMPGKVADINSISLESEIILQRGTYWMMIIKMFYNKWSRLSACVSFPFHRKRI